MLRLITRCPSFHTFLKHNVSACLVLQAGAKVTIPNFKKITDEVDATKKTTKSIEERMSEVEKALDERNRDRDNVTVFERILNKEIPVNFIHEDDRVTAFVMKNISMRY